MRKLKISQQKLFFIYFVLKTNMYFQIIESPFMQYVQRVKNVLKSEKLYFDNYAVCLCNVLSQIVLNSSTIFVVLGQI